MDTPELVKPPEEQKANSPQSDVPVQNIDKSKLIFSIAFLLLVIALIAIGGLTIVPHAMQSLAERKAVFTEEERNKAQELADKQRSSETLAQQLKAQEEQRASDQKKEELLVQQKVAQDAVAQAQLKLADPAKEKSCGSTGMTFFEKQTDGYIPGTAALVLTHYNSRLSTCLVLADLNTHHVVFDTQSGKQIMMSRRGVTSYAPEAELKEYVQISTLMSE